MSEIYLNNSFALRECLYIALEVCGKHLENDIIERVHLFAAELKFGIETKTVIITAQIASDLNRLILDFRNSHTARWIRDDFHVAINELEIKISRVA
ncbi:hypothetical protein [Paenibacillus sp. LjRoot56]|uniref:hypothetical protein n=1 Tax=Paenibacillus sp. LjRoot56 TaxID=3342333 RepID=UPI003ECFF3D6